MSYKLSVGFNGDLYLLEKMFDDESNKIGTLYTGGYLRDVTSGRYQHSDSRKELEKVVEKVHEKNARLAVTLNSPCNVPPKDDKTWWNNIESYLKELDSMGVDTAIIAHPFIMSLAKEKTAMTIAASIICDVNTPRGARYYEDMGADIIVPSSSINYDIDTLENIKANLKLAKLVLLVNEACLGNCPWRRFHQNALSHADRKGYDIDYAMSCTGVYTREPHMMLTNNVIRPEDLEKYKDITEMFKLVGRTTDDDTLLKMIHAYSTGEYHGNLVDIVDKGFSEFVNLPNEKLDGLFEQKTTCKKNCQSCNKCKRLYMKINNNSTRQ